MSCSISFINQLPSFMASKQSSQQQSGTEPAHSGLPKPSAPLAALTESTASIYKGIEALQQVHQHSAQRSTLRLQQMVEKMRHSTNVTDFFGIQSTVMLGGFQELALYLQDLALVAARLQGQVVSGQKVLQESDRPNARHEGDAFTSGVMNAIVAATEASGNATAQAFREWSSMMAGALPQPGR